MNLTQDFRTSVINSEVLESEEDDISLDSVVVGVALELEVIASRLARSRSKAQKGQRSAGDPASIAKKIIGVRQQTTEIFGELSLLHGPTLDILLDLFVNKTCGRDVSVSEASIAGRVAPTTGLRWVKVLIEVGLVKKRNDPSDQRRSFIVLTDKGEEVTLKCINAFSII